MVEVFITLIPCIYYWRFTATFLYRQRVVLEDGREFLLDVRLPGKPTSVQNVHACMIGNCETQASIEEMQPVDVGHIDNDQMYLNYPMWHYSDGFVKS